MKKVLLTAMVLGIFFVDSIFALGSLYARRPLVDENMQPLWLMKYNADVTISDQIAVTHVDQTFKNETSNRLEGIFLFPLPPSAIVTELALWVNGQRIVASIKEKDTARAIYEGVVRRSVDPAILEYMGSNLFKVSVFPIDPVGSVMSERRIEITYAELLPYSSKQVEYKFFMKTVNMTPKPVQTASIKFNLTSQKKILSLFSPSHESSPGYSISKTSDYAYSGIFGNENTLSEKDFSLVYKFESSTFALNNLTYVPRTDAPMFFDAAGDDPYYVLWVTTPDTAKTIPKTVVFIADISSSMAGTRIAQVKSALKTMVGMLNPFDTFNIVAFSSAAKTFKPAFVGADTATKTAAFTFINQLTEMGLTNMEDAFKVGLASSWNPRSVNSIVFLTDGKPTWPMNTTTKSVSDTVRKYNTAKVSLYTFGIGDAIDEAFLIALAKDNGGTNTTIGVDTNISLTLSNFMRTISFPLIKNCQVTYGGLQTTDVMPNPLPNLVATSQLTILGRYKGSGSFTVGFKGVTGTDSLSFSQKLNFPSLAGNQPFVPRMWASAKINSLLEQIKIYGELPELKKAVTDLGIKYSIVTPYTSLLALETSVKAGRITEDKTTIAPKIFSLAQNLPNPIRTTTMIKYAIPIAKTPMNITVRIYNAKGRLIRTLVNDVSLGGNFMVLWNARDDLGKRVAAGLYFTVLEAGQSRNMIQMRVM